MEPSVDFSHIKTLNPSSLGRTIILVCIDAPFIKGSRFFPFFVTAQDGQFDPASSFRLDRLKISFTKKATRSAIPASIISSA
jgi:hypothetical protein